MNCEIEFLPVGEASKAGDAIVIRYGEENVFELMVIDGGSIESGKLVIEHIRQHFGKDRAISHAVLTHPDGDHACGLREILSEMPVQNLWLHVPWLSVPAARPYFADKTLTEAGLTETIRKEYDLIDEIIKLATEKEITIRQPFAGSMIGPFRVVSPIQSVYALFLPQFDRTPAADQAAIEAAGFWIGKQPSWFTKVLEKAVAKAQKWIEEKWDTERLKDGGKTSATNESSVVLYGDFGPGKRVLLTADAGYWGLTMAAIYAENIGLPLQQFSFVQIPHHGSRSNVGPTVLNSILGPIQAECSSTRFSAFVSAPKDDDSHPRKMVLNAFIRRGARVSATQGVSKVYWGGFSARPGYIALTPMPFATQVEDYD
jgi:beta-lactamase superfamily II metal-dependent hydrolase